MKDRIYYTEGPNGEIYAFTLSGKPQERKMHEYPYSYSRYAIWNSGEWSETDKLVYTDRLRSQFADKYNKLKEEMLGTCDDFSRFEAEDIEKFLTALFEHKITLTGIEEECNASNGYPYWLLYYRDKE